MDKLNEIAKDYLADFAVLTEARKEFEAQLGNWWPVLFHERVKPALATALKDVTGDKPNVWENQSSPGMCHCRVVRDQEVLLQITDPRTSGRGCYTLSLWAGSLPAFKRLSKQQAFIERLDNLTGELTKEGHSVARKSSSELLTVDVPINPDDFEETAKMVSGAAVQVFKLVIENYRSAAKETKL